MKNYIFILIFLLNTSILPQERIITDSEFIPYSDTTLVFAPEHYNSDETYPLVFLLHGWSGDYNQWNEIISTQLLADAYNFIFVSPSGFYDSWYINSITDKNMYWEKYFIEVLYPLISESYSIDSSNIFITGLSMGGHGALNLFFKFQDYFTAAGSTSGVLDITKFPDRWGIKNYLGLYEENEVIWKSNSIYYIVNSVNETKPFIFDCGTEDFVFEVNNSFYELCISKKLPFTFVAQPGKHHRDYWKKSVLLHLDFFREIVENK